MININTNLSALNAFRNLSKSTDKIGQAIERLSTGCKINHASDNAAGSSIATNLSTQISSLIQVQNNTEDGLNLLATAQGALENIDGLLDRLRNLSMEAMNGTYDESSRAAMQKEADAIIEQIRYVRENTEFNGLKLFESMSSGSELIPLTTGESEPQSVTPQNSPPRSMSSAPRLLAKRGAPALAMDAGDSEPIEGAFDVNGSATETVTIDGITYTFKNKNTTTNSVSYTKDTSTGEITFMCNSFTITGQADVAHNIKLQGSYNALYGGDLDDTIEVIKSTSYANYVYGQGGNDTLINNTASTTYLYGGVGNDIFYGGSVMYGNDGNDTFNITRNSAESYGHAGDDTFNIQANSTYTYGGDGEDTFNIISGKSNSVDGGAGTNAVTNNGTSTTLLNVPGGVTYNSVSFAKNETKVININGIDYTITNRTSAKDFVWEIEDSGRINFKSTYFTIRGQEDVAHNVKVTSYTYFYGGNLSDTIYSVGNSGEIYGQGGDDNITLSGGYTYVSGGDGNDNITALSGYGYYSTIYGDAGNDTLTFNSGSSRSRSYVNMGDGDDIVNATSGSAMVISGGDGNNTYTGNFTNSLFYGFDEGTNNTVGEIYLNKNESTDVEINGVTYNITTQSGYAGYVDYGYNEITGEVYFGGRRVVITGQSDIAHNVKTYGYSVYFHGGNENDTITDYSYYGKIYGEGGDDILTGSGIGGYVYGNDGDDTITLVNAAYCYGGDGNDDITINSASRSYTINGQNGDDTYRINSASAYLTDTDGNNVYYVNVNNGEFSGGTGNDTFYVIGDGNTVHGGLGDDYFIVDGENNTIDGGTGNDFYVNNATGESGLLNVTVDPNSGILGFSEIGQTKTLTLGGKTFTVTNTGASGNSNARNQLTYALNTNTGVISFQGDGLTIEAPDEVNNIKLRGSDNLYIGGSSTDNIIIEQGSDNVINGGDGSDRIEMQSENNQISGDGGDDTIVLKASTNRSVTGGSGNDTFDIQSSDNTNINAGIGNNTIISYGSNNTISALDGNNLVTLNGSGNTYTAGNGNNDIRILNDSNTVTACNGLNKLGISGNLNTVTLENVSEKVNINGNNNVVNIEQNNNNEISIKGDSNTYNSQTGDRTITVLGSNNSLELLGGEEKVTITGNNNTLNVDSEADRVTIKGNSNNISAESGKKKVNIQGDNNNYNGSADVDDITLSGDNNIANGNGDSDKIMIGRGNGNAVDGGDGVRNTIINNGTNTRAGNVVDITPRPFELGVKVDTGSDLNSFVNVSISFNLFDFALDFMSGDEYSLAENLEKIDELRNSVSEQLVELGGAINRLDYALESQSIKLDNFVSSLSTIRDADIGIESAELIKYQILQQAAATLMSTANQSPSIALQLI